MKKYENYRAALDVLEDAPNQHLENEFIQVGVIDKFFLQFELGWKLFKVLLAYEGDPVASTGSPRQVIKAAYQYYDFMEEDLWLEMLRDRNNVAHMYDQPASKRLVDRITGTYIDEFKRVDAGLVRRYGDMLTQPD